MTFMIGDSYHLYKPTHYDLFPRLYQTFRFENYTARIRGIAFFLS